jgi:hypothetical protein
MRIIGLLAVVILLVAFGYFRIEQHLFRHSAEQLLIDMRALKLVAPSAEDVQRVVKKWGFEGSCSAGNCIYTFGQVSPGSRFLLPFNDRLQMALRRALSWLGAPPAAAHASIRVSRTAAFERFDVWIATPKRPEGDFLVGSVGSVGTLRGHSESDWDRPDKALDHSLRHPGYLVGTHGAITNADTGPRERVSVVWVEFSTDVESADVSRLMHFNFSCLTRLRSCREADLMPSAWAQLAQDERASHPTPVCTADLVKQVARIADAIAVVQVGSPLLEPPIGQGYPFRLSGVTMVKLMKGIPYIERGFPKGIEIDGTDKPRAVDGITIRVGEQYIFLLQNHTYGSSDTAALYPCGVLNMNPKSTEIVKAATSSK